MLQTLGSTDIIGLRFKNWRRKLKGRMPYVRRREYRLLEDKLDAALTLLAGELPPASQSRLQLLEQRPTASRDVCLFVTHAAGPTLKAHVVHHVQKLRAAGLDVVLVVNTDQPFDRFRMPLEPLHCRAFYLRENQGFDFAAWAHVALQGRFHDGARRLFLINDSVFGPVDDKLFLRLLDRIRNCDAELMGLTEAVAPRWHLQSYFLVMQGRALAPEVFERWAGSVRLLPTKELVIDVYETRLTAHFQSLGLTCQAMFPTDRALSLCSNDTSYRWQHLLQAGFPYIKVSVLARQGRIEVVPKMPPKLWSAWEREQSLKAVP